MMDVKKIFIMVCMVHGYAREKVEQGTALEKATISAAPQYPWGMNEATLRSKLPICTSGMPSKAEADKVYFMAVLNSEMEKAAVVAAGQAPVEPDANQQKWKEWLKDSRSRKKTMPAVLLSSPKIDSTKKGRVTKAKKTASFTVVESKKDKRDKVE